jgi:cell division protein FtsI (penicillin-binding protein 3)
MNTEHKKQKNSCNFLLRIRLIKYCFYICILAVIGRAFIIQNFSDAGLREQTLNIYSKKITLKEKRGSIFDRNGEVLAISVDSWDIGLRPGFKGNFSDYAKLGEITGLTPGEVKNKLSSNSSFTFLKRKASEQEIKKLTELEKEYSLDSRLFEKIKTHKRIYPNKELAGAVIGFSNMNSQKTGIEREYDEVLKGDTAEVPIVSAGKGNWYKKPYYNDKEIKPGKDVYLTLDKNIQHIAEEALEKTIQKFKAKNGKAVVMNPKTGEVLAMAQYPFFNPNSYSDFSSHQWNNRNALDSFEPGSVLKVFLAAGAIESEFCTKNSIYYCQNGSYKIGPVTIHDTKPYKWLPVSDIIKYSSNIGATKIAETVGRNSFYKILKDFGFGEKTGIDLAVETRGILRPSNQWTKVDTSNIAFGQGITASSIQMTTAVSVIANNGDLLKPYMVKEIKDSDGKVYNRFSKTVKKKVLSEHTAETLKQIMANVITQGTGKNAQPSGYTAGGKTGTSQKLTPEGKYSREKYISTFLGFAPAKDPEIAVMVAIDEPKEAYYGGIVAAPVFKDITTKTLRYLNVLPEDITVALKGDFYAE